MIDNIADLFRKYPLFYNLIVGVAMGWGIKTGVQKAFGYILNLEDKIDLVLRNQKTIKNKISDQELLENQEIMKDVLDKLEEKVC